MKVLLTIGEFSRMTYLSVKALRHYHEIGLLEPAEIDPGTGYRRYSSAQISTAQAIRRFRELDMPLDQVRAVLQASDQSARNQAILAHLERMEFHLQRTQTTVAALRALLEETASPISVEYRSIGPVTSLAIRDSVSSNDSEAWCTAAFDELDEVLNSVGATAAGPFGALYSTEFFEEELGEIVIFLPVVGTPKTQGRAQLLDVPGAQYAITVHSGSWSELDKAYGALGTFVTERAIGVDGPIREHYLVTETDTDDPAGYRTEVCWPISQ